MTDEDMEEIPDECVEARRWSWPYAGGVLISALANVGRTVVVACDEIAQELARHAEWARRADDAKAFASDVLDDLNRLPTAR